MNFEKLEKLMNHFVDANYAPGNTMRVSLAGKELSEENRAVLYTSLESISKNLKELSEKGLPENLED